MKAYWIAHVTVTDPDSYQKYIDGAGDAFKKYNAKILARGGKYYQLEGDGHSRNVVIEFESMQMAQACYDSEEYQSARKNRIGAAVNSLVLVEGVD